MKEALRADSARLIKILRIWSTLKKEKMQKQSCDFTTRQNLDMRLNLRLSTKTPDRYAF